MHWRFKKNKPGRILPGLFFLLFSTAAFAAPCQSELRILADDLAGVKLTSTQNQLLADIILRAKRHCWVQQELQAMDLINKARQAAGLPESHGEFDWENVPLESLEANKQSLEK